MKHQEQIVISTQDRPLRRLISWIENHDDSWLFMISYIGAAVLLSVLVSLFWLVVVVAVHFAFEYVKHHAPGHSPFEITARATWDVLLDIGLVFFALVLAIYLDVIFGAVGIGAGARLGVQTASRVGTRVAAWQRAIRAILLSLDDVVQVGRSLKRPGRSEARVGDEPELNRWGGWQKPWSLGDKLTLGFTLISFLLMLLSPFITGMTGPDVMAILRSELQPIP